MNRKLRKRLGAGFMALCMAFMVPLSVSAETVAMSVPHTIEYTLRFDSATLRREGVSPADWGMGTVVAVMALAVIALLALRRPLGGRA